MSRRSVAVLAAALLLVSLVGGVAVAQEASSSGSSEYTYSELKQDGRHYSVDSARIVPQEQKVYWLEHRPVNQPWRDVTAAKNGKKLSGMLKTDTVYLRTIRASDEPRSVDVTLVFWEKGTQTVTSGNSTTTHPVAENVSVVHKSVTLEPGWSVGKISLPKHEDPTRVTMWLDEHPDTARWTFTHQSVAFTQPVDADTWSEFVMLAAGFVILPALVFGAYGGRKVKSWVERAGEPPGHGFVYYAATATIATGALVLAAYYYVAELIVTIPVVLGVYVGVVYVGYMLATHSGKTSSKMFFQPHIESVDAFTSTKMPAFGAGNSEQTLSFSEDMPFGIMESHRVLDEGQDGLSVVRNGWLAFLARLKGGRARIENAHELKTRMSLVDSPWNEVFIVDPTADTLMEYEPPGLRLKTPEIDDWTDLIWPVALLGGGGVIAWQAAQAYGPAAWAVLIMALPILVWKFAVEGTDSYVHIDPAPVAMRPVVATMLVATLGYDDATSIEEAEEALWRTLAGQEQEKLEWERSRDQTFVDETFRDPTGDDADDTDDGERASTPSVDDLVDRVGGDDDD